MKHKILPEKNDRTSFSLFWAARHSAILSWLGKGATDAGANAAVVWKNGARILRERQSAGNRPSERPADQKTKPSDVNKGSMLAGGHSDDFQGTKSRTRKGDHLSERQSQCYGILFFCLRWFTYSTHCTWSVRTCVLFIFKYDYTAIHTYITCRK